MQKIIVTTNQKKLAITTGIDLSTLLSSQTSTTEQSFEIIFRPSVRHSDYFREVLRPSQIEAFYLLRNLLEPGLAAIVLAGIPTLRCSEVVHFLAPECLVNITRPSPTMQIGSWGAARGASDKGKRSAHARGALRLPGQRLDDAETLRACTRAPTRAGEGPRAWCAAAQAAASAGLMRVGSTETPGPIVDATVIFFT